MKSLNDYLVTFYSTHQALKAEKLLKRNSCSLDLIPTPREISSECGFSLLLKNPPEGKPALPDRNHYEHIYKINTDEKGTRNYEKAD